LHYQNLTNGIRKPNQIQNDSFVILYALISNDFPLTKMIRLLMLLMMLLLLFWFGVECL